MGTLTLFNVPHHGRQLLGVGRHLLCLRLLFKVMRQEWEAGLDSDTHYCDGTGDSDNSHIEPARRRGGGPFSFREIDRPRFSDKCAKAHRNCPCPPNLFLNSTEYRSKSMTLTSPEVLKTHRSLQERLSSPQERTTTIHGASLRTWSFRFFLKNQHSCAFCH